MGNCQKDVEESQPIPKQNKLRTGPVEQMEITCITWNKDYQGLFDYDSKDITKVPIPVRSSGVLMKIDNDFRVVTQLTKAMITEHSDKFLFKFTKKPDCFHIQPLAIQANNFLYEKSLWMIVKSTPQGEYSIREGDVIKLGRQKIRVKEKIFKEKADQTEDKNPANKEIICSKTVYQHLAKPKPTGTVTASNFKQVLEGVKVEATTTEKLPQQPNVDANKEDSPTKEGENQQPVCRICLDPGLTSNPLITPCKCSGSMRFIHLLCVQMWLGKRLNPVNQAYSVTINWKPLLCELCMAHFMYKIYLDNKKYYTVEIPRPPKPYLVLQVIQKDKNKNKTYSLVSFANKKKLNLGRKHDTDVRISEDISVSRHHSTIRFEDKTKQFFIEDATSKFGTLIQIKKRLVVRDTSSGLAIQVGPNVFRFQVRRAFGPPGQLAPQPVEQEVSDEEADDDDEDIEDEADEEEEANAEQEENLRNEQSPVLQNHHRNAVEDNQGTMIRNTAIMRVQPARHEESKEEGKEQ